MRVERIRGDFPILNEGIIYLDNASTSLTPEPVLEVLLEYYRHYRANVERGVHRFSQVASQKYEDAHRKLARFIGADENEVIFTRNTTEGINLVAQGIDWKRGDKVVTTLLEHHSNLIPWLKLRERGVSCEFIKPKPDMTFDLEDFERIVDESTRLVAISHVSNVLGTIAPVEQIAKICEENDALLLVDGAQSVPHMPVNVKELGCHFLAFSGHKMLGPTGIGVLYIQKPFLEMVEPLIHGGGSIVDVYESKYELKGGYEKFEAGTPNISGGIALGKAVEYLSKVGMEEIDLHEKKLTKRLIDRLAEMERVIIYGPLKMRKAVVSFNVIGLNYHDVVLMLDDYNIMVRSGHHCCIPLMRHLGIDGTARASLYLYNTKDEINAFLSALEEITRC